MQKDELQWGDMCASFEGFMDELQEHNLIDLGILCGVLEHTLSFARVQRDIAQRRKLESH